MKTYDRICPVCGCLNRKLYLEETDGLMECERCGTISKGTVGSSETITEPRIGAFMYPGWEWQGVMAAMPGSGQLLNPVARIS